MTIKYTKAVYRYLHDELLDLTISARLGVMTSVPVVLVGTLVVGSLSSTALLVDGANVLSKKIKKSYISIFDKPASSLSEEEQLENSFSLNSRTTTQSNT